MSVAPWRDQPREQARLFNPAFLGALVFNVAWGYRQKKNGNDLPFALSFVALPIILHKSTRDELPSTTRTSMIPWISANGFALVGFPERAKALSPLVKDAIAVAARGGLIKLDGALIRPAAPQSRINRISMERQSNEVRDCFKRATYVGRWLAISGEWTTVMAVWGVRP